MKQLNINRFTNQIKKVKLKSQEIQAKTSDDVLTISENIIPKVNREISYPGDISFAKQQLGTESNRKISYPRDISFAKQQLGTKSKDTKILGIYWNENEDNLSVEILKSQRKYKKRNEFSCLAWNYNLLRFISPVHPLCKIVYQESCRLKLPWDQAIPTQLVKQWNK